MNKEGGFVDPIRTEAGLISGTLVGEPGNEVRTYRGVPYAAPPVGELRWKAPQSVEPWDGVRECTQFAPFSAQRIDILMDSFDMASEDSLYLNVYTPANTASAQLPVMVWFHGGGLSMGSANEPIFNRPALPQHGVVMVLVNQRLGPLGYLAHSLLSEEQGGASGNYGTMDQIAALEWVQRNITAFGGDPGNVTIFGQSGGGVKVTAMLAAPQAKGLFHRAIIQSGSFALSPGTSPSGFSFVHPLAEWEQMGEALVDLLVSAGKLPAAYTLADLRSVPWIDLVEAEPPMWASLSVDGKLLPDQMSTLFKAGRLHDVPLMVGATEWENTLYEEITAIAETRSRYGYSDTFLYVFSHMPRNWREMYATHSAELRYIFGSLDLPIGVIPYSPDFLESVGKVIAHSPVTAEKYWVPPGTSNPGYNATDESVENAIRTLWSRFAATGDPSSPGLIEVPAYDVDDPKYLDIADLPTVKNWDCSVFPGGCELTEE